MVLKHPLKEQPGSGMHKIAESMSYIPKKDGGIWREGVQTKQTKQTKQTNKLNLYTLTLGISFEKSLLDRVGHTATAAFHQAGNGSIAGRQKDIRHHKVWFELKVQQGIGFRTSTTITPSLILTLHKAIIITKRTLKTWFELWNHDLYWCKDSREF